MILLVLFISTFFTQKVVKKVDDQGFLINRIERLHFKEKYYSVNHVPMGSYLEFKFRCDHDVHIKTKKQNEDGFIDFKYAEIIYRDGNRYKLFHFYIDEKYFDD